jgi:hypothetical protein
MNMNKWYPRLADVPKLGYEGSPGVDRTRLPGFDLKPRLERYEWDGKIRESLSWPMKNGSTSAAPATQLQSSPLPGETPARTALRHCHEALELPGTLSNYHFIIQGAHEVIWKHRRRELWVIEETERLCWLDLRLIQAHPEAVTFHEYSKGEGTNYPHVLAFHRLISLYETEGYLREAQEVAELAVRFNQLPRELERLKEKVEALDAEAEGIV